MIRGKFSSVREALDEGWMVDPECHEQIRVKKRVLPHGWVYTYVDLKKEKE